MGTNSRKNIEEIDWHRIFTLSHSLTPDSQLKNLSVQDNTQNPPFK